MILNQELQKIHIFILLFSIGLMLSFKNYQQSNKQFPFLSLKNPVIFQKSDEKAFQSITMADGNKLK